MAESNLYKILAQGQLPNATAPIASPGAGKCWLVGMITIVNTDTSTRTYTLFVNGTAGANQISADAESLGTKERDEWDFRVPLSLGGDASNTLQGVASVATKLTYTIWGDEVTL